MVLTAILGTILLLALWRCALLLHRLRGRQPRLSGVPVPARRPYIAGSHERCGAATCTFPASHAVFIDEQSVSYDGYCAQHLRGAYLDLIAENPGRTLRVRVVREQEAPVPQPRAA